MPVAYIIISQAIFFLVMILTPVSIINNPLTGVLVLMNVPGWMVIILFWAIVSSILVVLVVAVSVIARGDHR